MADKKIKGPDGNMYTEMQFPFYRKMGDRKLFKVISADSFLNITDDDNIGCILGLGKMDPVYFAKFMSQTSEATETEFRSICDTIHEKIKNAIL